MNGTINSHCESNGCYIGNSPIYRANDAYNFKPNTTKVYARYSYSATTQADNNIESPYNTSQASKYEVNLPQQHPNIEKYNLKSGCSSVSSSSSSTAYYNRIHAQVRSNVSVSQHQNLYSPPITAKNSAATSLIITNETSHQKLVPKPTSKTVEASTQSQVSAHSSTLQIENHSVSSPLSCTGEPALDYPHYTMDSLIQRLVPSDTHIPQQSFLYPMLLCSRIHIQPNMLLNKLAQLTMNSIADSTRDRNTRIMKNFLHILTQWTRTFPYDFRSTEMMSQLTEILNKINSQEPTFQTSTYLINKRLRSKLKILEHYEEYIQKLNTKSLNNLNETALFTDIINECPTPILFAQQLTHIELDRLKPIGAEELIQYFITKSAMEEARARPNRIHENATDNSNNKSLDSVHNKKLTSCLETYVQWFNHLTFFVTTEIVKHTQRTLRIRLINYFIDAAYECFRLNNFNSMMGIIGGLNMLPVKRLKRTWEKIKLDKLQQLEKYMNVSRNFSNYRYLLKSAMEEAEKYNWESDKIVIPFTSIVLQDVYFIKTHSKDYTPEGGINLKKYYSMAKFISNEFVQCKQCKCSFERNDVIINYISTSPVFNENSLMLASFECEQAVTPNEKEKWMKLQATVNGAA